MERMEIAGPQLLFESVSNCSVFLGLRPFITKFAVMWKYDREISIAKEPVLQSCISVH